MRRLILSIVVLACFATACGKPIALRPEWDDPDAGAGTVGGRWTERGMLDTEGRGPASAYSTEPNSGRSWVGGSSSERTARDRYRGNERQWSQDGNVANYADQPNLPPSVRRQYKNGLRATRADFTDDSSSEGSR